MFYKFEKALYLILESKLKKLSILLLTAIVLVASVLLIPYELVLAKMLPGKNSDTFNIYIDLPNGSSISQTKIVSQCVIDELQKEREITDLELFLGMGSPLDFAGLIKGSHYKNSENVSEIVVNLKNKHHREEPSYLMVQRIRPQILEKCEAIFKNTTLKFVEPPAGPPTMGAVVAEIYGSSENGIRGLAERVKDVFKNTSGLVDIDIMQDEIFEKVEISIDTLKIARSGLDIKQINDILYLNFEGMNIAVKNSKSYDDQTNIFLTLQKEDKIFKSTDLKEIELKLAGVKLMNSSGMMVPISEVIHVRKVLSNPMIVTKNLHLMTNVLAETDMVSQVYPLIEARSKIIETFGDQYQISEISLFDLDLVDLKTGELFHLKWDGEMRVTIDTFIDLGSAFIAAMVLIFLLMVLYYKSYALSSIVLIGSILSIIGVILGHRIMDYFYKDTFFLTATSLIGFIALIGISSRNSLLLIDFAKSLIVEKSMPQKAAIAHATATRAKPIFLTATAIILASTLLASDAVFGGLGVSLIFGTISAVVASLIVVPILLDEVNLEN
jgi:multidrug efflux pump subunit AcrB